MKRRIGRTGGEDAFTVRDFPFRTIRAIRTAIDYVSAQSNAASGDHARAAEILSSVYARFSSSGATELVPVELNILQSQISIWNNQLTPALIAAQVSLNQLKNPKHSLRGEDNKYLTFYVENLIDYCTKWSGGPNILKERISYDEINFHKVSRYIRNKYPMTNHIDGKL